jgi:hypothetical protein
MYEDNVTRLACMCSFPPRGRTIDCTLRIVESHHLHTEQKPAWQLWGTLMTVVHPPKQRYHDVKIGHLVLSNDFSAISINSWVLSRKLHPEAGSHRNLGVIDLHGQKPNPWAMGYQSISRLMARGKAIVVGEMKPASPSNMIATAQLVALILQTLCLNASIQDCLGYRRADWLLTCT